MIFPCRWMMAFPDRAATTTRRPTLSESPMRAWCFRGPMRPLRCAALAACHFMWVLAQRAQFSRQAPMTLHAEALTIGEMMQSAGYATAHFGKWNPGAPNAGLQFYDASDGPVGNQGGTVNEPGNPKGYFRHYRAAQLPLWKKVSMRGNRSTCICLTSPRTIRCTRWMRQSKSGVA